MKIQSPGVFLASAAIALPFATTVSAVDKAATGTELTDGASWAGGTAPTSGQTAAWGAASSTGAHTVNSAVTWSNITFAGTSNAVSITGSQITLAGAASNGSYNVISGGVAGARSIGNDLILSGVNSTTAITVGDNAKRLQLDAGSGDGGLTLGNVTSLGGALANDANLWLRGTSASSVNTITGTLTVDGQLGKGDTGTWVLSGSNSIGWVYVNNGTLLAGNNGAFGAGTVYLGSGGGNITLGSTNATTRSFANALDFTGGTGFTSTATFGQATGGTGTLSFTGAVNLGGASRNIATNVDTTFSGVVSGTGGGITKTGSAKLTLSNVNTYTGVTTISAGILAAGDNAALGASGIQFNGGTLASTDATARVFSNVLSFTGTGIFGQTSGGTGALSFSGAVNLGNAQRTVTTNVDTTFSGIVSGTGGGIAKNGTATLTLLGENLHTGVTSINAGTLAAGHDGAFGASQIRLGGGTLASADANARTFTTGKQIDFASSSTFGTSTTGNLKFIDAMSLGNLVKTATVSNAVTEFSGKITDTGVNPGNFIKAGTGELILSGNNEYARGTVVEAGTLTAGHANAFGSTTGGLTVTGGTLALGTFAINKAIIALNGGTLTGSAYTGTVNVGGNAAISGTFAGTVITGTNAERAIDTTNGLIVGSLTGQGVFSGGTVNVTTQHHPGNSTGSQTFNNGLAYGDGASLNVEIAADGLSFDRISVLAGLEIGDSVSLSLSLFGTPDYAASFWDIDRTFEFLTADSVTGNFFDVDFSGLGDTSGQGDWSLATGPGGYTAVWTAVPEPSSALLAALGALALLRRSRR